MIKDVWRVLRFIGLTHKKQLISFSLIFLILILFARLLFSESNLFFWNISGILLFVGFSILFFLFSAYLGYLFRTENKANFLVTLPFSKKALMCSPHLCLFIFALVAYLLLKDLWGETHIFMGVSELLFLFFLPYVVFYSLRKIEAQWVAVLVAFVTCLSFLFVWMKFLATWNIYQWGIVTELFYGLVIALGIFFLERKVVIVAFVSILMVLFLLSKTVVEMVTPPKSYSQAVAKVQFFPHRFAVEYFTKFMLKKENWKGYEILPGKGVYQRKLFKFSRHYIDSFWSDEEKIKFLDLMLSEIRFDKKNDKHYYLYSYKMYPLRRDSLSKNKRIHLAKRKKQDAISCYFLPLAGEESIVNTLFANPECAREKILSDEIRWLYYKDPENDFLELLESKLRRGKGRENSKINWGVSTLFGIHGRANTADRGEARSWYKTSGISDEDFARMEKYIFFEERKFFEKFQAASNAEKVEMIDALDFETRGKNRSKLKFICRQYSSHCDDLPRWEDRANLIDIIQDHFASKKFPERYYYWLAKEVKRNL